MLPDLTPFIIPIGFTAFVCLFVIDHYLKKWDAEDKRLEQFPIYCNIYKEERSPHDTCNNFKDHDEQELKGKYHSCFWCANADMMYAMRGKPTENKY